MYLNADSTCVCESFSLLSLADQIKYKPDSGFVFPSLMSTWEFMWMEPISYPTVLYYSGRFVHGCERICVNVLHLCICASVCDQHCISSCPSEKKSPIPALTASWEGQVELTAGSRGVVIIICLADERNWTGNCCWVYFHINPSWSLTKKSDVIKTQNSMATLIPPETEWLVTFFLFCSGQFKTKTGKEGLFLMKVSNKCE